MRYELTVDYGIEGHMIKDLTEYELDRALEQLHEWFPDIGVSIEWNAPKSDKNV